jgi:hypothetical protein
MLFPFQTLSVLVRFFFLQGPFLFVPRQQNFLANACTEAASLDNMVDQAINNAQELHLAADAWFMVRSMQLN